MIGKKAAKVVLESEMLLILCVGESEECREKGSHLSFVADQLERAFEGIDIQTMHARAPRVAIAYEPIWSIGTGKTPTVADVRLAFVTSDRRDARLHQKLALQALRQRCCVSSPNNIWGSVALLISGRLRERLQCQGPARRSRLGRVFSGRGILEGRGFLVDCRSAG